MTDILKTKDGKVIRANPSAGTVTITPAGSPYFVGECIHTIWADATDGPVEIHLPPPNGSGRRIRVMKVDETTNRVEVKGKRVNGQASVILSNSYEWGLFHDAGDDWFAFQ